MVRRDRSEQGDDPAFPQKKRRRLVRRKDPASQRRKQLEKYFEGDSEGRFHLEQPHGRGGQASVWKIKYVEPGSSGARAQGERFLVVKLADPARGSDVEGVTIERAVLEKLQGCRHIVRIHNLADDPLAPAADERGWAWIYLEALENGTLTTFMTRSKSAGLNTLPNRLLWRLFLCMVRACIAMAWPCEGCDENETALRKPAKQTGIVHNDIHGGNLMFGSSGPPHMDSREHDISPMLKLIDFGQAQVRPGTGDAADPTGEQCNIEDIGIMMATLIKLQTDSKYTGQDIEIDLTRLGRRRDVVSPASGILPEDGLESLDPCPHIDPEMRLIIAACMAECPADRPTLAELENWICSEIQHTTTNSNRRSPGATESESDDEIFKMIQTFIFNPDKLNNI